MSADHLAFNASPSVSLGYGLATLMFAYLAMQQAKETGRMDWSAVDNDEGRPA